MISSISACDSPAIACVGKQQARLVATARASLQIFRISTWSGRAATARLVGEPDLAQQLDAGLDLGERQPGVLSAR